FASDGAEPNNVVGDIEFRDVSLKYPSRDDVLILNNVTFKCPAKKTTAIVGPSGCGKSSVIGLLERFYEPTGGSILLDDKDIQLLNLRWLRSQVSLVGQEPVLFDTTIFKNIENGIARLSKQPSNEETRQRVMEAAKQANAHDFIAALPESYDTRVGEKGIELSGGQRQRIAIARALMNNPWILLLDEATSVLDVKSESVVQKALDVAAKQRTTIIIAHRLSTIRNADNIVVMTHGGVMEQGNHEELVQRDGVYASLVRNNKSIVLPPLLA
ncbi:putative lipid A export ATP-binding/permease protein msbA, partial [Glonium stellatum]